MKKWTLLFLLLLVASLFLSCTEEEIQPYDGPKTGIYFYQYQYIDSRGNPSTLIDSTSFSFAGEKNSVMTGMVGVRVATIGDTYPYDRTYRIEVVEEKTNAVQGTDFKLSNNKYIIKANESTDVLGIQLIRTPALLKKSLYLTIKLVPNNDFDTPIDSMKSAVAWNVAGKMISSVTHKIIFSEIYDKPSYWNSFGIRFFGEFTVARFLEVNKLMGWTPEDWGVAGMKGEKIAYGRLDFVARLLQQYLQKMADEGTPILDDDGSYMQLPENYEVDYSHLQSNQ